MARESKVRFRSYLRQMDRRIRPDSQLGCKQAGVRAGGLAQRLRYLRRETLLRAGYEMLVAGLESAAGLDRTADAENATTQHSADAETPRRSIPPALRAPLGNRVACGCGVLCSAWPQSTLGCEGCHAVMATRRVDCRVVGLPRRELGRKSSETGLLSRGMPKASSNLANRAGERRSA